MHFNALYFRTERAEQLWLNVVRVTVVNKSSVHVSDVRL